MYNQIKSFIFLIQWFDEVNRKIMLRSLTQPLQRVNQVRDNLLLFSKEIEKENKYFSERIFSLKDTLFDSFGLINPYVFGQIFEILKYFENGDNFTERDRWAIIHPQIIGVSKNRFIDGYYADAAESAFKEINLRVKNLYHRIEPTAQIPDGKDVMNKVFSKSKPMVELCDRSTVNGENIQLGFMEMFSGAMSALRNPKAHENMTITADDAFRQIVFASMLMYKIDEGVDYSHITELL